MRGPRPSQVDPSRVPVQLGQSGLCCGVPALAEGTLPCSRREGTHRLPRDQRASPRHIDPGSFPRLCPAVSAPLPGLVSPQLSPLNPPGTPGTAENSRALGVSAVCLRYPAFPALGPAAAPLAPLAFTEPGPAVACPLGGLFSSLSPLPSPQILLEAGCSRPPARGLCAPFGLDALLCLLLCAAGTKALTKAAEQRRHSKAHARCPPRNANS